ncbi:conserved hypothetical protein [Uncinocarpus reesii 1704]|uniref:Altered inheritance of mitochondria protein 6 n=1 Tax=Uncinocarpus reesii (strain UAMH 1704) TaxID=336963 RepID=C4JL57_UNCRE|nr:uncharacterized protein UREG_00392 [Uncinocarpus reesii 1704]EEP75546.1 conserved hypothetical protein [Uncinocarpus reesii 1704]
MPRFADSLNSLQPQSEPLLSDTDLNQSTWQGNGGRNDILHQGSLRDPSNTRRMMSFGRPLARFMVWLRSIGRGSDRKGDIEQGEFLTRRQTLGTLISLLFGIFVSFFPSYIDETVAIWGKPGGPGEDLAHWATDITADIRPVACHSHNDYWRRVPLYSAIQAGCIGVEADVWLFNHDLYVGHTKSSLTINRTLTSLYIDPLLSLLEKQNPATQFQPTRHNPPNGIFDTKPDQTLALLVDFKTNGSDIWPYLTSQLTPLRERGYLTHFNGTAVIKRPITVVATGNAPFDLVVGNSSYRDIFFDAPLAELSDAAPSSAKDAAVSIPYDFTNSYYASVSFRKSIGFPWRFQLSDTQRNLVKSQIKAAHDRGLKVRYWNTPSWPRSLRNLIWTDLIREGVDILNVDDLKGATKTDWSRSLRWNV